MITKEYLQTTLAQTQKDISKTESVYYQLIGRENLLKTLLEEMAKEEPK